MCKSVCGGTDNTRHGRKQHALVASLHAASRGAYVWHAGEGNGGGWTHCDRFATGLHSGNQYVMLCA